jgi:hypothetical protein
MNPADVPAPRFDPGRSYLVTGRTLNALSRAIRRRTPTAGPGIRIAETADAGFIISTLAAQAAADGYLHPFKIRVSTVGEEIRGYVNHGAATARTWNSTEYPVFQDILTLFGSGGELENDPFLPLGGTVGYEVLSASTTYGVWLIITITTGTADNPGSGEFDQVESYYGAPGGSVIGFSSDYTTLSQGPAYAAAVGGGPFAMIYLGQVSLDSSGEPTIRQHRRSDVVIPIASLPKAIQFPEPP